MANRIATGLLGTALAAALAAGSALAQEKRNMELVGYNDLQGRSAYQPVIHKQGGRWIAYVGHHGDNLLNPLTGRKEDNGTSFLDVTDPRKPVYLAHIPGEPGLTMPIGCQRCFTISRRRMMASFRRHTSSRKSAFDAFAFDTSTVRSFAAGS